uniref:Kinesin-like protein n=1 Tax=Cyprinodon variegatus TaxID=28743 RepID=A0A3Q2DTR6_CYPVA
MIPGGAEQGMMQIYLRVRPFTKEELCCNENQDCVVIEDDQTVTLSAPKGSATMKSSEKGIGLSIHKFSFSKVFGPQTTQVDLFEDTVRSQVFDFLEGKNALIFSYGVTNAGKTFTIQGTPKDPGILPRVLDATFHCIGGHQYKEMDLKPYLRNGAQFLDPDQVKQERTVKATILASVKEVNPSINLEFIPNIQRCDATSMSEATGDQFALWVAFFEIYNECVYDLLQPSLSKKRSSLRVCDDGAGNAYVKDLRWINIQNLSEANKLVQFGNKNRSAAATKMNHSSSRSHSIFTMKLLKIEGQTVKVISEFSLCDLAGSERCNKTKTFGERLKEAGNINNSLLILGKCINALRNSQADGKSSHIPFRESKLTKLFQAFFCGKGRASMIVNINQCASTYDETLHVMKFSAVAKQVGLSKWKLRNHFLLHIFDLRTYPELLDIIDNLRTRLLAERRKNLVQEVEIRKEMGDAMLQQILESEELRLRQIEELKESYAEKLEDTFEMFKDAIKEHAYQCAMNDLEDNYVPLDDFLKNCSSLTDDRYMRLYKEKCVLERMCEDKQELILSLEKRLIDLSQTLEDIRVGFLEKSADLEALQKKADEQVRYAVRLNAEKDREIASLKTQIEKLSQKSPVQPKPKKGFLANIKEAVTSPRKGASSRSLRKTPRTPRS